MTDTSATERWSELVWFQTNIAESWLERGRKSVDPFAQFFFYFSGFNALYFLWKEIDALDTGENKQIENLLRKFPSHEAKKILQSLVPSVSYFSHRRPIQRMGERTPENQRLGTEKEGRKWQTLLEESDPIERLNALGQIIYLVRSNLVHGSKTETGHDEEVIKWSLRPLEEFLTSSLILTRRLTELHS